MLHNSYYSINSIDRNIEDILKGEILIALLGWQKAVSEV
jgi:hypothetical protein